MHKILHLTLLTVVVVMMAIYSIWIFLTTHNLISQILKTLPSLSTKGRMREWHVPSCGLCPCASGPVHNGWVCLCFISVWGRGTPEGTEPGGEMPLGHGSIIHAWSSKGPGGQDIADSPPGQSWEHLPALQSHMGQTCQTSLGHYRKYIRSICIGSSASDKAQRSQAKQLLCEFN